MSTELERDYIRSRPLNSNATPTLQERAGSSSSLHFSNRAGNACIAWYINNTSGIRNWGDDDLQPDEFNIHSDVVCPPNSSATTFDLYL